MRDNRPHRIRYDSIYVAFVGVHDRERPPRNLRVAIDIGVGHERHGQVASPRQAVALDAVNKEIVRAQRQRPFADLGHLPPAGVVRNDPALHGTPPSDRHDLDVSHVGCKAQIPECERVTRPPAAVRHFVHRRVVLEILRLFRHHLGNGLADKEPRLCIRHALDVRELLRERIVPAVRRHKPGERTVLRQPFTMRRHRRVGIRGDRTPAPVKDPRLPVRLRRTDRTPAHQPASDRHVAASFGGIVVRFGNPADRLRQRVVFGAHAAELSLVAQRRQHARMIGV